MSDRHPLHWSRLGHPNLIQARGYYFSTYLDPVYLHAPNECLWILFKYYSTFCLRSSTLILLGIDENIVTMEDHTNLSAAPTQTPFDIGFATDQKYMIYLIGAFALAGLYSVGTRVYSFIRLLLSLFVLPGKPVYNDPDLFLQNSR